MEGLGHVVVGAELEADDAVDFLTARRQHDHRRAGVFVQALADRQAVFAGHHVVQHHQADIAAAQHLVHFPAAGGGVHFETVLAKEAGNQVAQFEVIIDDQDAGSGGNGGRNGGRQGHGHTLGQYKRRRVGRRQSDRKKTIKTMLATWGLRIS